MKASEIKEMALSELVKRREQIKEQLFDLNMKHAMGQVANPLQIRVLRKDLARTMMALTAKTKKK